MRKDGWPPQEGNGPPGPADVHNEELPKEMRLVAHWPKTASITGSTARPRSGNPETPHRFGANHSRMELRVPFEKRSDGDGGTALDAV